MTQGSASSHYMRVRQERDAVIQELREAGAFFASLGRMLNATPIRVMFANVAGVAFGAPAEIALSREVPSVDYSRWPEKAALADLLRRYYELDYECRRAYEAIPEHERRLIAAP